MNPKPRRGKVQPLRLEKIIGSTGTTNYSLSVHPLTGQTAYIAGSVCVIYDSEKNKQIKFLTVEKPISCVCYSPKGRYLALGTHGNGGSTLISIFDLQKSYRKRTITKPHVHSVYGIRFSMDEQYFCSVGSEKDKWMKIWRCDTLRRIAGKKFKKRILGVTFSLKSSYICICGQGYVKYYLITKVSDTEMKLVGKPIRLSNCREKCFVAADCSRSDESVYAITSDGTLCMLGERERIEKWVNLKTSGKGAFSIEVSNKYIVCGCGAGIIRLFQPGSLQHIATLPKPPPSKMHVTSVSITEIPNNQSLVTQSATAVSLYERKSFLMVYYSDRSIFIWDVNNINNFAKIRSFLCHGASIRGLDVISSNDSPLAIDTLVTCSDDNTVRFWDLGFHSAPVKKRRANLRKSIAVKSVFCRDIIHVLKLSTNDQTNVGIKSVKFSPDGNYVATGDLMGNVRVHDTTSFQAMSSELAHNDEVTCLDFCSIGKSESGGETSILCSGSKDNMLHLYVFSADRGCELVHSMNDHKSPITSLCFSKDGRKLVSAAGDKKLVFRNIEYGCDTVGCDFGNDINVETYSTMTSNGIVYDVDTEATKKYVVTCSEDCELKIWDLTHSKTIRSYSADKTNLEPHTPFKVKTDPSGINLLCSGSDCVVRLYDFYSGSCYASAKGHVGVVTGMVITSDCKRLITCGMDGLMFVWRFSKGLTTTMNERLKEMHRLDETKKKMISEKKSKQSNMLVSDSIVVTDLPTPTPTMDDRQSPKTDGNVKETEGDEVVFRDTLLPDWMGRQKTPSEKKQDSQNTENKGEKLSVWDQRKQEELKLHGISVSQVHEDDEDEFVNYSSDKSTQDEDETLFFKTDNSGKKTFTPEKDESKKNSSPDGRENEEVVSNDTPQPEMGEESVLKKRVPPVLEETNPSDISGDENILRRSFTQLFIENLKSWKGPEIGEPIKSENSPKIIKKALDVPKIPPRLSYQKMIINSPEKKISPPKLVEIPEDVNGGDESSQELPQEVGSVEKTERIGQEILGEILGEKVVPPPPKKKDDRTSFQRRLNISSKDSLEIDDDVSSLKELRRKVKLEISEKTTLESIKEEFDKKLDVVTPKIEISGDLSNLEVSGLSSIVDSPPQFPRVNVEIDKPKKPVKEVLVSPVGESLVLDISKEIDDFENGDSVRKTLDEVMENFDEKDEEEMEIADTIDAEKNSSEVSTKEKSGEVSKEIKPILSPEPSKMSPVKKIKESLPTEGVRLSRAPGEYLKALTNLKSSFSFALSCFDEINKDVEKSKNLGSPNKEGLSIMSDFCNLFGKMQNTFSEREVITKSVSFSQSMSRQSESRNDLQIGIFKEEMENYSSRLISIFEKKLDEAIGGRGNSKEK